MEQDHERVNVKPACTHLLCTANPFPWVTSGGLGNYNMLKYDIIGEEELAAKLERLPIEVADLAVGDAQDYLLNVLRSDQPSPNYVTRKAAYGVTFFDKHGDDRQRRWFFAALADGRINVPYRRTQGLSKGWKIIDRGVSGYIVNDSPGAKYVVGDGTQSRHEKMVGWKTISQQVKDRLDKINKIVDAAAKKAIKKLGL